jgi:molecular chaperone IbpA
MLLRSLLSDYDYYSPNYTLGRDVPYNFIRISDSELCLEFNVVGIDEKDLDIEVQENILRVSANPKKPETKNYIVNGLHANSFTSTFTLKENFRVKSANVKNGILRINMELIVPEEKKPKKISITH